MNRKLFTCVSILVVLGILVLGGGYTLLRHKQERERSAWKATTLARLANLSITSERVQQEVEKLKGDGNTSDDPVWIGQNVLLMTNGEYLVYASRHGLKGSSIPDLFLAHGSDGRWYYSTYHFCNRMVGILIDDPPSSIAEFASRYAAREFDGNSEARLEQTWP